MSSSVKVVVQRVGRVCLLALFLFLPATLVAFSSPYVINPHAQLVPKTEAFVHLLAQELQEKTGVSLYLVALENLEGRDFKSYEEELAKDFKRPYAFIFFAKKEKKIDVVAEGEVEKLFDKKDVYWNYIVPLIPKKENELTASNISAMLLNGYVQIADSVAEKAGVKLEHSFVSEDKGTKVFVRVVLYFMMFTLLLLFVFRWIRKK
ncbi:MAG: TPM domain-containing protein [Wolinella succinogenes]|nr:TPM domain-containing protein [Wolinella succinogenes]NLU35295.1 TPM domain-containing protein [Wolinella succinogenes]